MKIAVVSDHNPYLPLPSLVDPMVDCACALGRAGQRTFLVARANQAGQRNFTSRVHLRTVSLPEIISKLPKVFQAALFTLKVIPVIRELQPDVVVVSQDLLQVLINLATRVPAVHFDSLGKPRAAYHLSPFLARAKKRIARERRKLVLIADHYNSEAIEKLCTALALIADSHSLVALVYSRVGLENVRTLEAQLPSQHTITSLFYPHPDSLPDVLRHAGAVLNLGFAPSPQALYYFAAASGVPVISAFEIKFSNSQSRLIRKDDSVHIVADTIASITSLGKHSFHKLQQQLKSQVSEHDWDAQIPHYIAKLESAVGKSLVNARLRSQLPTIE